MSEDHEAERAGRAALADGRWEEARERFEQALAGGAGPGALEGLGWAAWWLDDEATVFEARERAYRVYRTCGDSRGAARTATWLAADHLDFHGAAAVASGWLRRAHRLLDPLPPRPEHGWLAFHEGYLAHRTGDSERARASARAAAELGRDFGVPDLEMLGLALEGAVLVAAAELGPGMALLDEATAAALEGEATIPISSAWTCCFLVSACTAIRDNDRAFAWCDRIAAFAERFGSRYMLAFCRSEYGLVELERGRWDAAETLLAASAGDFAAARPGLTSGPLTHLAELRRRQGRPHEADLLLDRADATTDARLCRARIASDRGDARRAVELAERALRRIPANRPVARVPALELLVRGRIARGELREASAACAELRRAAHAIGTPALLASADLAEGMLAAARGDHLRARRLLEDAVDGLDAGRAPFEAARARRELATSLAALGLVEAAADEAAASVRSLEALGAAAESARSRRVLDVVSRPAPSPVTRRERDVLRLLATGMTNRQIAERLVVSEHTVHRHVTNILRKLDLHSRTAAAAWAVAAGVLREP